MAKFPLYGGRSLLLSCVHPPTPGPIAAADTLGVGPILFVTAAGSVLEKIISETSLVTFITERTVAVPALSSAAEFVRNRFCP